MNFTRQCRKTFFDVLLVVSIIILCYCYFNFNYDEDVCEEKDERAIEHIGISPAPSNLTAWRLTRNLTLIIWDDETEASGNWRFRYCPYYNCYTTKDRTQVKKARAIVFHTFRLDKYLKDLPQRYPWQDWALITREPPYAVRSADKYSGQINILAHYRRDADIQYGYGFFEPLKENRSTQQYYETGKNFAENKTGLVTWIVSNCKPRSLRNQYVDELKKYIPIDIYGHCSNRSCGVKKIAEGKRTCMEEIEKHKFYLSFENQLCPDYITEKFWNSLTYGTVPIVLGGANYAESLVKGSYIDVKDFSSPKLLAEYLLSLDKDDKRYNRYFDWRYTHTTDYHFFHWCKLCEHLNVYDKPQKSYKDLYGWLNDCKEPRDYYKGTADMIVDAL